MKGQLPSDLCRSEADPRLAVRDQLPSKPEDGKKMCSLQHDFTMTNRSLFSADIMEKHQQKSPSDPKGLDRGGGLRQLGLHGEGTSAQTVILRDEVTIDDSVPRARALPLI